MNRIRFLAVATVFALALPALAQQSAPPAHRLPNVDEHLKVLSEKLELTADQQEKARPILKKMQDSMQKVMNDTSLTPEQMHAEMRPAHEKADKELRAILTEDQKKKLDELEAHSHPDMHPQQ
jgi:hypothetical protein